MGLPHRDYSVSVGSDADTETDGIMSPEHAVRLWGRSNTKSGRSSCLSSRANSNLTLTDTEHENTENGEFSCPCALYSSAESGITAADTEGRLKFNTAQLQIECVMPLLYGNDVWFWEADFVTLPSVFSKHFCYRKQKTLVC